MAFHGIGFDWFSRMRRSKCIAFCKILLLYRPTNTWGWGITFHVWRVWRGPHT